MDVYLEIAEAIKKDISEILHKALAGYLDDYKHHTKYGIFVKWAPLKKICTKKSNIILRVSKDKGR